MALKVLVGQIIMNHVIRYEGAQSTQRCFGKSNYEKWRVLVMDKFAMRIVSACLRMHDLTEEGITLVEEILKEREPLPSMDAIYFITPSEDSVLALLKDFEIPNRPWYRAAYVYFTESIPQNIFLMLKRANIVKHMKACTEINIAFIPYEEQVFSFDSPDTFKSLYSPNLSSVRLQTMERIAEQIATLCVTLEEYPAIRYRRDGDNNVELAQLIQQKLAAYKVNEPTMGKGPEKARSQLLILDRGFDCVTPLLHELTFQAMIYDLLHVVKDIYTYVPASNASEMKLLLDDNDKLWVELRHQHIFAVSEQVKQKLKEFNQSKHMIRNDSQLKGYLEELISKVPQRQKELSKYTKHVRLAEDCWKAYKLKQIDKLCSIEQDLAVAIGAKGGKVKDHIRNMYPILVDESVSSDDKIRIIILYVMMKNGISEENLRKLFERANISFRQQDVVRNLKYLGINNVPNANRKRTYTIPRKERNTEDTYQISQWTPVIKDIMEQCISNKLDRKYFPFLPGTDQRSYQQIASSSRYGHKDRSTTEIKRAPRLIVFIVGGATFSEMRCAYEVNSHKKEWDVIVGSSHIITPEIFIKDLSTLSKEE